MTSKAHLVRHAPGFNSNSKAKMSPAKNSKPRIAIVGSGCAGIGGAWALRNTGYEVHLFEKASRLGGHTNTQIWKHLDLEVPVDTGFIVMNTATYPNFLRFLKAVGVDTVETEMTFGVSRDGGKFEWSGEPRGIFAQRRNLFRWRHWRMIFDIVRFNQFALDLLEDDDDEAYETRQPRLGSPRKRRRYARDLSIGQYLQQEGYSDAFRDDYLIPMTAAVWSTSPDKASLEFPATTLVRFMWNHHLLTTIAARPPWLTIPGGSRRYVDAVLKSYPEENSLRVHTGCEVANILRPQEGVEGGGEVALSWIDRSKEGAGSTIETSTFAHVIVACHGDEILPILTKNTTRSSEKKNKSSSGSLTYVTQTEHSILSAFQTTPNTAYLHSDLSLMPSRRACWTAWNYLISSSCFIPGVSLTYDMNILQHIPVQKYSDVLVTINPPHPPDPAKTQGKFEYRHPLYTIESVRAQNRLKEIQGIRGVSYAGAWTKYGFHEDGFTSGLQCAVDFCGGEVPWGEVIDSEYARGHVPVLGWRDFVLRVVILMFVLWMRLVGRVARLPVVRQVVGSAEAVGEKVLDVGEDLGLLS